MNAKLHSRNSVAKVIVNAIITGIVKAYAEIKDGEGENISLLWLIIGFILMGISKHENRKHKYKANERT